MKPTLKTISARTIFIFFTLMVGSCNPNMEEICSTEISRFDGELRTRLAGLVLTTDRALASLDHLGNDLEIETVRKNLNQTAEPSPEDLQRNYEYQEWSIQEVKRLQSYLDVLKTDPSKIEASYKLSRVVDHLVMLSGYAEKNDIHRMTLSLTQAMKENESVKKLACK